MESSSFSHKEPVHFDFPNAFRAIGAEIRRAFTWGHLQQPDIPLPKVRRAKIGEDKRGF